MYNNPCVIFNFMSLDFLTVFFNCHFRFRPEVDDVKHWNEIVNYALLMAGFQFQEIESARLETRKYGRHDVIK